MLSRCKSIIKNSVKFVMWTCVRPSSKKIFFQNFHGRGFGDDPRYICEELHKRNPKLKMYWQVKDKSVELPSYVRPIKRWGLCEYCTFLEAKVWISNAKGTIKPKKKKNQSYIQCWHSTIGMKKNEQDAHNLLPEYVENAKRDAAITDFMYSDNDFRFDKYSNRYWYNGPVLRRDVPRVGTMMNRCDEFRAGIQEKYNIPKDKKIVAYLPTFRHDKEVDVYNIDHSEYIKALEEKFGGEFVLINKLHPNLAGIEFPGTPENAFDATMHEDPYEIVAAADVLISDFSGCLFEALLVDKPVFLIAKDLDTYLSGDRGIALDTSMLPCKIVKTEQELADQIRNFDAVKYHEMIQGFKTKIGFEDSGNGAAQIADLVEELLKK